MLPVLPITDMSALEIALLYLLIWLSCFFSGWLLTCVNKVELVAWTLTKEQKNLEYSESHQCVQLWIFYKGLFQEKPFQWGMGKLNTELGCAQKVNLVSDESRRLENKLWMGHYLRHIFKSKVNKIDVHVLTWRQCLSSCIYMYILQTRTHLVWLVHDERKRCKNSTDNITKQHPNVYSFEQQ